MVFSKRVVALVFVALLATGSFAFALPVDEPIRYPEIEMDENLVEPVLPTPTPKASIAAPTDPGTLEMDESAIGENEEVLPKEGDQIVVQPSIGGLSGNKMSIKGMNSITFETPMSEGVVDFTNPEESTVNMQYLIRVTVAELLRTLGRTGYSDAEYATLSAQEGFDPETEYIVLAQTKGVPPGKRVHTISLGTLPDGTTLGVGTYKAQTVITAYDVNTNQRSMVGANMEANITVKTDQIAMQVNGNHAQISLFTPAGEISEIRYELVVAKTALESKVSKTVLDAMKEEYHSLGVLGHAKPGEFLEADFSLKALPDGTELPQGEYDAWIIRYEMDAESGQWKNKMSSTMVNLLVSP